MQKWHEYIISNIETIGGEKIEDFEVEKTEHDIALIEFTEAAVDRMLHQYGRVKQINIPISNIHILKPNGTEEYTKGRLSGGAHSSLQQSILVDREKLDIQFSIELFHELLHVKCFKAFQIIVDGKSHEAAAKVSPYRQGISVISRDGKKVYLKSVEEAIISYLTEEFHKSITREPLFKEEMEAIDNSSIVISRQNELAMLQRTVDIIYEKNKGLFPNREAILQLFIDGQVNGNLLKIHRLIENTFGLETLKKIDPQTIS